MYLKRNLISVDIKRIVRAILKLPARLLFIHPARW
jgi:hypothetical protein